MKLRSLRAKAHWSSLIGILCSGALLAVLLGARLARLLPVLTHTEQRTLTASAQPHTLLTNPLHLPLKVLQWLTTFAPHGHAVFFGRLPSVGLAFLSFYLFVLLARRWYGNRGMVFGALLFATSAWFLHVARFSSTDIEYLAGILVLLFMHLHLHDHANRPVATYSWLLVNLLLLFIPGFVWFVAFSALTQWRTILSSWKHLDKVINRSAWLLVSVAGLATLIYTFIRSPKLLRVWAGVPSHFATWDALGHNIAESFTGLLWHGPHAPELWLGHLPLLDFFTGVMLLAGVVFYIGHWRAQRTHLLFGYILLGGVLAGLGGAVRLAVIMPIIYLVILAGIAYVLHFWLRVFPRNPIARAIGLTVIVFVIAISCFYNLKQYFVAWPHNPETVALEHEQ